MSMVIPESARIVIDTLLNSGPLAPKDISRKSNLPLRTVSFALRKLLRWRICRKIPNLHDMRRPLYHVDPEQARAIFQKYGKVAA